MHLNNELRFYIWWCVIIHFFDIQSTIVFMILGYPEGNPIGRWMFNVFGFWQTCALGYLIMGFLIWLGIFMFEKSNPKSMRWMTIMLFLLSIMLTFPVSYNWGSIIIFEYGESLINYIIFCMLSFVIYFIHGSLKRYYILKDIDKKDIKKSEQRFDLNV